MHTSNLVRAALAGAAVVSTLTAFGAPSALVAHWDFNNSSTATSAADSVRGVVGTFAGATAYSADAGGASGAAGDKALDFGSAGGATYMRVGSGDFLNLAGYADQLTVAFWQKRYAVADGSTFWANATTAPGSRGAQAHVPWSNQNIYFDTSGCCGADTRLNKDINADLPPEDPRFDWTQWHHFVFVKNLTGKQIYVDGVLFAEADGFAPLMTDFTSLYIGSDGAGGGNLRGLVDDFAVFAAPLTADQIASLANRSKKPTELGVTFVDADNDNLPDVWEVAVGLDPAVNDAALDPDGDGLTNANEFAKGTNPKAADTDSDGLNDKVETGTGVYASATDTGTNPTNADTDGDGLLDGVETNSGTYASATDTGSSPFKTDTDGDGFGDGTEVQLGSDPTKAAVTPLKSGDVNLLAYWKFNDASVPEAAVDKIHGIPGIVENAAAYTADQGGRSGAVGDKAMDFGADGAGQRVRVASAQWLSAIGKVNSVTVTFWQQVVDSTAGSSSFWGISPSSGDSSRGIQAHSPWSNRNLYWDTGNAGPQGRISKAVAEDFDFTAWHHYAYVKSGSRKQIYLDGVLFHEGNNTNALPSDFTTLLIGAGNGAASVRGVIDEFAVFAKPLDAAEIGALAAGINADEIGLDADNDGMGNVWEIANGLNPNSAADAALDPDGDTLTNLQEFQKGTNPKSNDTDGDTLKDNVETKSGVWAGAADTGTDPVNPDTDGDGFNDGVETNTGTYVSATNTGTDPNKTDSDGDGFGESVEAQLGSNPADAASVPVTPGKLNLLAHWDFNNASVADKATDKIHGFVASAINPATTYTADQGGRTGAAGDFALEMGPDPGPGGFGVNNAAWVNTAGVLDQMTVSFWQRLHTPASSSTFWFANAAGRAFQAHVPWGDGTIYFDTSGCCGGDTRINRNIQGYIDETDPAFDWTQWHHFVFLKDGATKQIWIDGNLFHSGTGAAPLPKDMTAFGIGAVNDGTSKILGQVDEFLIYAAALTEAEIDQLKAGTLPPERTVVATTELLGAAAVEGPYAKETTATVDTATKTITYAVTGNTRFFRVSSASAVSIKSITANGSTVTIKYE